MKKLGLILFVILLAAALAACSGGDAEPDPAAENGGDQGNARSLAISGQSALDAGNFAQAISDFETSIESQPSLDAYFGLGNAYTRTGQFGDAQRAYEKALEINPNHTATLSNLGVVYYQQGQLPQAEDTFNKALSVNPGDAATHYLLGAVYMQLSDLDNAEKQFKAALDIQPNLPEARYGMAILYQELGRIDEAIAEFEAFLGGPAAQDPRARGEAQRLLDELKAQRQ